MYKYLVKNNHYTNKFPLKKDLGSKSFKYVCIYYNKYLNLINMAGY